jgi:heterodisulfide reductase subunit A
LKDIPYSVAQGSGAAAQAAVILSQKALAVEPTVARVNEDACSGCKVCESACGYRAINVENMNGKDLAKVTEGLCRGCGNCASACPVDAITMPNYTDKQIVAQVKAVLQIGAKQ